jgi:glycosyl transferase family 25
VQTIVINLPSDDARWVDVRRQFYRAGLRPIYHEATDGTGLSRDEIDSLYSADLNRSQYHRPLSTGEIGCYASHLAVWKQFLDSGQGAIAIFEDDIDIDEDLAYVLDAIGRAPVEGDLVKLIGRPRENILVRMPLMPGRDLVRYRRVPSLTGAYVLTRSGAQKLVAHRQPFGRPVDVDIRYWWECGLQVLGIHPYPVRGGASSRWTTIQNRDLSARPGSRWSKLRLQARYSFLNWSSLQAARRGRAGTARQRRVAAAIGRVAGAPRCRLSRRSAGASRHDVIRATSSCFERATPRCTADGRAARTATSTSSSATTAT